MTEALDPAADAKARGAETRTGVLASAGAALLFGSSFASTAFALRAFGPVAVGAWRGLIAAIVLGGLVGLGRIEGRAALARIDRAGWLRLLVLGVLGGPAFVVGMNVAVGGSGATIAAFVAGLYAVLAALLGPLFLGERLGIGVLVAFLVALGGTGLLAEGSTGGLIGGGIGAGLVAATSFALYLVLSRRWARSLRLPGAVVALAVFAATAIVLVPLTVLMTGEPLIPATSDPDLLVAVVALAWLAIGPSVAAQLLLVAGVRRLPARRSSAFLLLNPVTAALLAAVLLGERLSPARIVGAGLVLTGIALASGLPALLWSARPGSVGRGSDPGAGGQGPTGGSAATR